MLNRFIFCPPSLAQIRARDPEHDLDIRMTLLTALLWTRLCLLIFYLFGPSVFYIFGRPDRYNRQSRYSLQQLNAATVHTNDVNLMQPIIKNFLWWSSLKMSRYFLLQSNPAIVHTIDVNLMQPTIKPFLWWFS